MLVPVILCGGKGTRLWPLSRELFPKHVIPLVQGRSLLEMTADRVRALRPDDKTAPDEAASRPEPVGPPVVVSNDSHRFMVAEKLRLGGVDDGTILLEPAGRNTAPAVCCAALQALAQHPDADPLLLVMPSDHAIGDAAIFARSVRNGLAQARAGKVVLFGIAPCGPSTGYGYIRKDGELAPGIHAVERFVEKPGKATARAMLEAGGYVWNSGIFLFSASTLIAAMECHAPDILASCREAVAGAHTDLDFVRLDEAAFGACRSESIDYAVLEKADNCVVVDLPTTWSDLGSFDALYTACARDESGNAQVGDVLALDVHDSYLHAEHGLLTVVGVRDVAVVATKDAVLVTDRTRAEEVKELVGRLQLDGRSETVHHPRVYRPWGSYETIDLEERFQVKRITVHPGAELSLQMHHHRAEHWIVVKGSAEVTRGDKVFLLGENESTYIPLGTTHRLKNPGKLPLELIEVQSGSYLGEDDIVRFEDNYGRGEG